MGYMCFWPTAGYEFWAMRRRIFGFLTSDFDILNLETNGSNPESLVIGILNTKDFLSYKESLLWNIFDLNANIS